MQENSEKASVLLDDLRKMFARAKLPSSPALATQILDLANNPNSRPEQFADLIQIDAALSARLLKMANSAHFSQRSEVTTIQRAVTLLGVNRVRTAALGFQLAGHLNKLGGCAFDMTAYWQHSVLRACLARELGKAVVPALAEEAFLVGLLQDSGILLLVQLLGKDYANFYKEKNLSPVAFYHAECKQFKYNHVQAVSEMGREWHLPETIIEPLGLHHTQIQLGDDATEQDKLNAVCYLIGSMRLVDGQTIDASETSLQQYVSDVLKVSEATMQNCMKTAGETYSQMVPMLAESLPEDVDVTDLLSEANRQLSQAAGNAEGRVENVQAERDKVVQQQENLKTSLGEYRERAARDPLTQVLNRGALLDSTRQIITRVHDNNSAISVLFLDIDNFKKLNDGFGHKAGDDVLCGIAAQLDKSISNAGCLGRYGGEEFILVIPELTESEARQRAEKIVQDVREVQFPEYDFPGPVTCSLGCVWATASECKSAEQFFQFADELMYVAKNNGKNQYRFRSLTAEKSAKDGKAAAQAVNRAIGDDEQNSGTLDTVSEKYRRIADQLNRETSEKILNMRKQQRKVMLSPCTLSVIGEGMKIHAENAYVRNISTGGIGLLTTRPMGRGEPVEVNVDTPASGILYVAGLVAFCRHVHDDVHVVGVQFTAHAKQPIFSDNPTTAVERFGWLAQALKERSKSRRDEELQSTTS